MFLRRLLFVGAVAMVTAASLLWLAHDGDVPRITQAVVHSAQGLVP